MPWATITQTVPRRLHSTHTLCGAHARAAVGRGSALITSSSWRLLIGQPLQLEVDGDVRADRRRGRAASRCTRARRRRSTRELLDVGEVAQRLDAARGRAGADRDQRRASCARTSRIRSASCGVVIEPSTSETSYGPSTVALAGLQEVGDLEPRRRARAARPRSRAGSAGSRRRRRTSRPRGVGCVGAITAPGSPATARARSSGRPGRRGRRASVRAGSGRSGRCRTACCAPSRRRCARRPRRAARSAATAKRIITSGPQSSATVRGRRRSARAVDQARDDADVAAPLRAGAVDGDARPRGRARRPALELVGGRAAGRARGRRRAARRRP